jgi:hypothetical protein
MALRDNASTILQHMRGEIPRSSRLFLFTPMEDLDVIMGGAGGALYCMYWRHFPSFADVENGGNSCEDGAARTHEAHKGK